MRAIIVLSLLLTASQGFSQLKKIKEVKLKGVNHVSIDRLGNFYFVTTDGRIHKYDATAKEVAVSEPNSTPLSLIEAWNPLRVFTYYASDSTYHIFNYNLELLEIQKVDPSLAITPALVCPGNEPTLWILDEADFSLKKINRNTTDLILESDIDSVGSQTHFTFMREYQNYLFMGERGVIRILNSLGKPVNTISTSQASYFNFLGEEICFRRDNRLILLDLYTAETRTIGQLTNSEGILYSIISDERVALVRKDQIEFYTYRLPQN